MLCFYSGNVLSTSAQPPFCSRTQCDRDQILLIRFITCCNWICKHKIQAQFVIKLEFEPGISARKCAQEIATRELICFLKVRLELACNGCFLLVSSATAKIRSWSIAVASSVKKKRNMTLRRVWSYFCVKFDGRLAPCVCISSSLFR